MSTVTDQCKETLKAHYGPRLAGLWLFGSAARGEAGSESDLDLLVLLRRPLDYFEELRTLADILYPVQLGSDRLISAKPASVDAFERGETQLYRNAKRQGKPL
ncbi:MAG: nucleotidyltransferase domain-containing protein [Thermodesulfobacteriota bacterium]